MNKYLEFISESNFYVSEAFKKVIANINDRIARDLETLIDRDIKTIYNALNITIGGNIWFVQDSQLQRRINSGDTVDDIFSNGTGLQQASALKIIRSILEMNGRNYTHSEIVNFYEKYKAECTIYLSEELPIRAVSGDEIKYWYLEDNYCKKAIIEGGPLGKSCMRFDDCQEFMDIYVNNPKSVQLVILTDTEYDMEVLRARALLWKTSDGYYLDRVYYTDPAEEIIIQKWVSKNYPIEKDSIYPMMRKYEIRLEYGASDYYPYMDTFCYIRMSPNQPFILYNYIPKTINESELYLIQDTDGYYEPVYNDSEDDD